MSYRNKTYVIFSSDDIRYYNLMLAWKENDKIEFDFNDAHDIGGLREDSQEETVKRRLRERFSNSKQVVVLIGENTRYKYKYVRWEIEVAQDLDLPIVAINLNGDKKYDSTKCPAVLRDKFVLHVAFNAAIIKRALDFWPDYYETNKNTSSDLNLTYKEKVYTEEGL